MSDEKKFGVWEQPKDGSANGQWSVCRSTREAWIFSKISEAEESVQEWNGSYVYKHLHHEVRQLPEDWWNLSAGAIYKLICKD